MDRIDNLKLAIYESGLPDEDIEAMLEYVEEKANFGTVDIGGIPIELTGKDMAQAAIIKGTQYGAVGGLGAAAIRGAGVISLQNKQKKAKDRLEELCNELKITKTASRQKELESQIDKCQNEIRELDEKIAKTKKKMKTNAAIGAASVGAHALTRGSLKKSFTNRAEEKLRRYVNSVYGL